MTLHIPNDRLGPARPSLDLSGATPAPPQDLGGLAWLKASGFAAPAVLLAAAVGLPAFYCVAFLHETDLRRVPPDQALQLLLSTLANLAAFTTAFSLKGRFDRKLTQFVAFALLTHGLLATSILGFRLFYLKGWFFSDALVSLVVGLVIVSLRHQARPPRLAVIDSHGRGRQLTVHLGEVVTDPSSDLSAYDIVLLTDPEDLLAEWAQPLSRAMLGGRQVRHWAEYLEETRGRISIEHFHPDQLPPAGLVTYQAGKRLFDLGVSVLLAPIALPLLLAAMAAIKLGMGGPVFFSQMRVGRGGRPFRIWKLRTMRPADPTEPARSTLPGDARVTPLGRLLRRLRIDELPQLWNVIIGEMSLIGPRPEITSLAEGYAQETPAYAWRHLVRPGVSGWAQVRAPYAADLAETRVKLSYDLFYVKNMSISLDLQILARTLWTLISGGGVR
jgi:lipopolysaccharide/colanic/teichoic acid biosynthesis glycosyltransferase